METSAQKKELYRTEIKRSKSAGKTLLLLFITALFIMAVFAVARFFPAAWLLEIGAIAFGTVYINKLLNEGTFKKTYVLYEDSLCVITKYGLIEKETASYDLKTAVFTCDSVTANGKTEPFFPDDELKRLLNL